VLVNDGDLDRATAGMPDDVPLVRALAHKSGYPAQPLTPWVIELTKAMFTASAPVECGPLHTKVRWAVSEMTNQPVINKDLLVNFKALADALAALKGEAAKPVKRRWWEFWK